MRYATIKKHPDMLPASGTWPLVGTERVLAPCTCCKESNEWDCKAEQIIRVRKSPPPNIIYGGRRRDGYHFFLFKVGKTVRVRAGCRDFSPGAALRHWDGDSQNEKWSRNVIGEMEKKAIRRGWIKSKARAQR
jgi:hypothetical protein